MIKLNKKSEAAVLALFCVFIMSVFLTLILCVRFYQGATDSQGYEYENRLALSYIWTKIKNGDEAGMIRTGDFHGLPALFIGEEHDGAAYEMAIYHYDGFLCQIYYEVGYDFLPEYGERIVKCDPLTFKATDNGLTEIWSGGESVVVFLRSGG